MHSLLEQSVFFGVAVSIVAYEAGSLLKKKYHSRAAQSAAAQRRGDDRDLDPFPYRLRYLL